MPLNFHLDVAPRAILGMCLSSLNRSNVSSTSTLNPDYFGLGSS